MIIQIDISGQIQQKNFNSSLGFRRSDGLNAAVYLPSQVKKAVIKKYKGQVIRLIEKIHCILIYYCIKNYLNGVNEIIICKDVDFRSIKRYLPLLFNKQNYLKDISIKAQTADKKSNGHKPAVRAFRKRSRANLIITKEMVEEALLRFKKE